VRQLNAESDVHNAVILCVAVAGTADDFTAASAADGHSSALQLSKILVHLVLCSHICKPARYCQLLSDNP
jgi:hypothetical protein